MTRQSGGLGGAVNRHLIDAHFDPLRDRLTFRRFSPSGKVDQRENKFPPDDTMSSLQ